MLTVTSFLTLVATCILSYIGFSQPKLITLGDGENGSNISEQAKGEILAQHRILFRVLLSVVLLTAVAYGIVIISLLTGSGKELYLLLFSAGDTAFLGYLASLWRTSTKHVRAISKG